MRHRGDLAAELVLSTVILAADRSESPFFYYTLATALLGGPLYGWAGAALFSPMLVAVYYWVISVRPGVDEAPSSFQTDLGQPALYLRRRGGRRGRARAAGPPGRRGGPARRPGAPMAAEAERSRLARDMHDSLAKTVSGIGFAALALLAPDRARPQGGGRGGAAAGRGRAAGDPRGARDHHGPAHGRGRRAAAAADRAEGRGRALGGRRRRSRLDLAIEDVGRARRGRRARARVDPARGAAQRRAPRARDRGRGAAADARRPRRADDRRRRRGLRGPGRPRPSSRGGATSASPACASAPSWRAAT